MEKGPDQTAKMGAFTLPPIDPDDLETPERRESALDALATWFVDALISIEDDYDTATALVRLAIGAFFDVREAASESRGAAERFFRGDGVGIGPTRRAVPWRELETRAPVEHFPTYVRVFDEVVVDVA
ncbi:hypothetical protein BH09MYX1_BH09MYX1_42700 [soil metagenome]